MLGRLNGQSWFAVERPPGRQWFFSGDYTVGRVWDEMATTIVGALRADLEPGKIYFVRADFRTGAQRGIRERIRESRDSPCLMPDFDNDLQPMFADLVGVLPGSADWARALTVLRHGVRYQAAPRNLDETDFNNTPARGRARLGRCLDIDKSRLAAEHGVSAWPIPAPSVGPDFAEDPIFDTEEIFGVRDAEPPTRGRGTCPQTLVSGCLEATDELNAIVRAQCLARSPEVRVESDVNAFVRVVSGTCALPETVELQVGETRARLTLGPSPATRWRFVALAIVEKIPR
ncbi:MAG: hypothetical protein AB8H86_27135 [Polyangiales bacterium]